MVTGRDFTLGAECTMQCADGVSQGRTLETCMPVLTNVTTINSVKKLMKQFCISYISSAQQQHLVSDNTEVAEFQAEQPRSLSSGKAEAVCCTAGSSGPGVSGGATVEVKG